GVVVPVLAGERALRPLLAQHLVLRRGEEGLPFRVRDRLPLRVRLDGIAAHASLRCRAAPGLRALRRRHAPGQAGAGPQRDETDEDVASRAHALSIASADGHAFPRTTTRG